MPRRQRRIGRAPRVHQLSTNSMEHSPSCEGTSSTGNREMSHISCTPKVRCHIGGPKERAATLQPRPPPKRNLLKHTLCTHDDIKGLTWFTLQPKLATEISWWNIDNYNKQQIFKYLHIFQLVLPATSTQVFLVFPMPKSKCWDGSQDSKLPLRGSHVALPT